MRIVLALVLLLLSSPAFAQQLDWTNAVNVPNIVVNPSMDNCASGVPTCGAWKEAGFPLGDWVGGNSNGGALDLGGKQYTFSYVQGTLYQDIDLSQYNTNLFNFTFSFDLNNSCRNYIGGACDRVDGPIDPFSATLKFYDANGLNNQFNFLSGTPSTANIGCADGIEIFGLCLLGQVALDNWQSFGWYSHVQSNSLFTSARLEFTGNDAGFWGGLYGPSVDNAALQINYMPPLYPTSGGGSGMNVAAPGSNYIFIYKGNDPVLFSQLAIKGQDLVGWTAISGSDALKITNVTRPDSDYLFLYTDGIPKNGSWYSFQEQSPTVDCTIHPTDPSCAILALTDPATIADTLVDSVVADATDTTTDSTATGSDSGSDDGTSADEEETMVADESTSTTEDAPVVADTVDNTKDDEEEDSVEETVVASDNTPASSGSSIIYVSRELSDEEKAAILADAISKSVLESALSIANNAAVAGSSAGVAETTASVTTSKKDTGSDMSSDTNPFASNDTSQMAQNDNQESGSAADIFDTGRVMGQQALANTLAASAETAEQAGQQAESIAQNSSLTATQFDFSVKENDSYVAIDLPEQVSAEQSQQMVFEDTSIQIDQSSQNFVFELPIQTQDNMNIEVPVLSDQTQTVEQFVMSVIETAVENNNIQIDSVLADDGRPKEIPGLINSTQVEDETLALLETIKQSAVSSFDDDSKQFEEAIVNNNFDPQAAAAFGTIPTVANLEILGVLNNKPEEKSDAEKRADQIVAANQQQMEEINKNYMDADQSGILGAIGADGADVNTYRTAMIADAAQWYKDKDIYKGVVIKDNVRSSYFLEKGNTDLYKKLIEEQYK